MWIYLVVLIIAEILTVALSPKPPQPKPATLADFDVPTADPSRAIPVVFGTITITGPNVVWYGDLSSQAIHGGGGKK